MYVTLLLAVVAPISQQPASDPNIAARVEALLAKANGYEHFIARYRMHNKDGGEGDLRLVYLAPDSAKFESRMGDSGGQFAMLDGTLDLRLHATDGKAQWAKWPELRWGLAEVDGLRSSMGKAFPDAFHADDLPKGAGVLFSLTLDETPPADKSGLNINLSFSVGPTPRFAWLRAAYAAGKRNALSTEGADLIAYAPSPSVRMLISADSGLVQRIERREGDQSVVVLTLESVDFASVPERAEFQLPPPGPGALDLSAEMRRSMGSGVPLQTRTFLYEALQKMSADGRLRWDEPTRAKLLDVLAAEHRSLAEHALREGRKEFSEVIGAKATQLRGALAGADGRSDARRQVLAAEVQQQREQLDERCATLGPQYASLVLGRLDLRGTLAFRAELEELEKSVVDRAFELAFTKPVLAEFDEQVAKQLEAK